MTQEERWLERYKVVRDFMERNHRNPSKHYPEERLMRDWLKHNKKLLNAGKLKPDRVALFEVLLEMAIEYRRVNQFG